MIVAAYFDQRAEVLLERVLSLPRCQLSCSL